MTEPREGCKAGGDRNSLFQSEDFIEVRGGCGLLLCLSDLSAFTCYLTLGFHY